MELKAKIDFSGLHEAFNKFPIEAAKELRLEVKGACKAIQKQAKAQHRFKTKSGNLENSIHFNVDRTGLNAVIALDKNVKYAAAIHDGSKPHRIYPKDKAALAFVKNGRSVLVPKFYNNYWRKINGTTDAFVSKKGYVNHPGTRPDPFLYKAAEQQEPYFVARVKGAISRIKTAAGLK